MIDSKVLENAYEDWKAGTFIKTSTPRIDPSQVVGEGFRHLEVMKNPNYEQDRRNPSCGDCGEKLCFCYPR